MRYILICLILLFISCEKYSDFCDEIHIVTDIISKDQFVLDDKYICYLMKARFEETDKYIGDTVGCIKEHVDIDYTSLNKYIKVRFPQTNIGFTEAMIIGEIPRKTKSDKKCKKRR